jgi:predicted aspartyl protease
VTGAEAGAAAGPTAGPGPTAIEGPPVQQEEPLYAAPTTLDRIGRVMAPVMVNGQGPFRFVVDTGASRSAISPRLAERLGLVPEPEAMLRLHGVTGEDIVPSVVVARIQAGDIVMENHRVPVIAPQVFADADGILGVEGFAGMRITVDFENDRILISRTTAQRTGSGWYRVPARMRFGLLMIANATIAGVRVTAVIDTGAERTLGNLALRKALRLDAKAQEERTATQVLGATGALAPANSIPSPIISFGQANIARVNIAFADLNVFRIWNLEKTPALVLGMDVLGTPRAMILDYKRSEIQVRP